MKLPKYIDCKNNTTHCEYYLSHKCEERCPYALDIRGLGCGAMVSVPEGLEFKLLKDKDVISRRKE